MAGAAIDARFLSPPVEGPRVKEFHLTESREGAAIPVVYGRCRVGGQLIWATRFKERRDVQGGKGGRMQDLPGALAYFKDALGIVHLRGSMLVMGSQPAVTGVGYLQTSLPLGYRPQTQESHLVVTFNGTGRVDIYADGSINVATGHTWQTRLDGIHFRAGG